MVAHICSHNYADKRIAGVQEFKASLGNKATLCLSTEKAAEYEVNVKPGIRRQSI